MANGADTTYTTALSTYVLALLEHPKTNNSMKLLMDHATRNHVNKDKDNSQLVYCALLSDSRTRESVGLFGIFRSIFRNKLFDVIFLFKIDLIRNKIL